MILDLEPVVIFIGNYGSGKTEVSVNVALALRASGATVQIADLDLVNPYFRSREVRDILEADGIDVVVPDERLLNADLPILVPKVQGIIQKPQGYAILDVGGDDVGATVLGSLNTALKDSRHDMLQVVNAKRPFTDTVAGCTKITSEIERAARLKVTGVVGNTHLMDDTDLDTVIEGYRFSRQVAEALGVPLKFISCPVALVDRLDRNVIGCPVLPLKRQLLPPWTRKQKMGSKNFLLS
jgi:hypothetical protein